MKNFLKKIIIFNRFISYEHSQDGRIRKKSRAPNRKKFENT